MEILSAPNVVRRERKTVNGAPNKRISCIELGEADCEGWLTKKSTPNSYSKSIINFENRRFFFLFLVKT